MKHQLHKLLILSILVITCFSLLNCAPKVSESPQGEEEIASGTVDDLTAAKTAIALYFIAIESHQFDEARKYVTSDGGAMKGIDELEGEVRENPSYFPINQNPDPLADMIANLEGSLNGGEARLWWAGNPDIVYLMVKENGVWLFQGNADHPNT